jgi:hypothetical protein
MTLPLKFWTDCVSPELSIDLYRDFASSHALQGGVLGRKILPLIKREDYQAMCGYNVEYGRDDMSPIQYYHLRQSLAFFSKLEFLDIGIDKERAALDKFLEAESLCRETNEVFRAWSTGKFKFSPAVDSVLSDAARKIAQVLGPVPSISKLGLRFGPGATTLTRKRDANPREKLRAGFACSDELLPVLSTVLQELAAWTEAHPGKDGALALGGFPLVIAGDTTIFDASAYADVVLEADVQSAEVFCRESLPVQLMDEELSFALKNAMTYRTVSKPPPLNSLVQLGYGDFMSKRLARFGIDLKDQSINQRLAREGSLTGELATLDLSSASDTVATELVYHLLPVDWAIALSACRCGFVSFRGERLRLEKFSSMGNGYTFPLESLIFWALAKASCDAGDVVSVYGDDIILPVKHVALFSEVLTACGFVKNTRKSYASGPFRESCGADWYRGFNIRPYYAKKMVSGESLYSLHNYYARTGQEEFRERVEKLIPKELQLFGPDGFGDGVLLGPFEKVRKASHRRQGYGGFCFQMHKHVGLKAVKPHERTDFAHALYTISHRSKEGAVTGLVVPKGSLEFASTLKFKNFLASDFIVGDALPFYVPQGDVGEDECFIDTKVCSIPGTNGSKAVLIYTFGD